MFRVFSPSIGGFVEFHTLEEINYYFITVYGEDSIINYHFLSPDGQLLTFRTKEDLVNYTLTEHVGDLSLFEDALASFKEVWAVPLESYKFWVFCPNSGSYVGVHAQEQVESIIGPLYR